MAQYWVLFTHKAAPISTPVLLLFPVISEEDADSFQAQSTEEEKQAAGLFWSHLSSPESTKTVFPPHSPLLGFHLQGGLQREQKDWLGCPRSLLLLGRTWFLCVLDQHAWQPCAALCIRRASQRLWIIYSNSHELVLLLLFCTVTMTLATSWISWRARWQTMRLL